MSALAPPSALRRPVRAGNGGNENGAGGATTADDAGNNFSFPGQLSTGSGGRAESGKKPTRLEKEKLAWVIPFISVVAQALGLPRLWGASADACSIAALFFSTSMAFATFLDEEVLLSLFFPVSKKESGLGLSSKIRALNWIVGHVILVMLVRICDPERIEGPSPKEVTIVFIGLSYVDFIFGMACAARRRALGQEPDLGLYTGAAGPAVVYAIFLAYVAAKLNVSLLPLILATNSAIVFALPVIHAMVLSPHLASMLPSFFEFRVGDPDQREATNEDDDYGVRSDGEGLPSGAKVFCSTPRVAYVALCVILWCHTPPLKVALLLRRTPPQMLTAFRVWTSAPMPVGSKVFVAIVSVFGGTLVAVVLILSIRICCRGCTRFLNFARVARKDEPVASDVEASAITFGGLLEEHNVATRILECGWGTSFHFATRHRGESPLQSILRHQYLLAGKLGVRPGLDVLECGGGLGGPARNIARFTGANVIATSVSKFQVIRGNDLSLKEGMRDSVELVQTEMAPLPFPDSTFGAVYAIESIAKSADRAAVYREIFRTLKRGGSFATYEWCLTDKYNPLIPRHREIKAGIEGGNGAGPLLNATQLERMATEAGFHVWESRDCALDVRDGAEPWFLPVTPSYNPMSWPRFQFNPFMRWAMPKVLRLAEKMSLLPQCTGRAQAILQAGGEYLGSGGAEGLFTPMWLIVAEKPLEC